MLRKHLFRFTLLFAMIVFVVDAALTACTSPPPRTEPVVITFVTYHVDHYLNLAEAFHEDNPGIEVQVRDLRDLTEDKSYQDLVTDLEFSRRLAESADVVPVGSFYRGINLYDGIRLGLLYDLRPFLAQDPVLESLFVPQAIEALTWQGALYGLPWSFYVPLMVYNKQLFDDAGVPYPMEDWTWDDFLSTAQALADRSKKQVGFVDAAPLINLMPLALIAQNGGRVIASTGAVPEAMLDDPVLVQSLEWYVDLSKVHDVMPVLSPYDLKMSEHICPGQVAMWSLDIRSSMTIHSFRESTCISGTIARWPRGKTYALPMIVDGYGISAGTRYAEAAWRWLAFLSQQKIPSGFTEWSTLRSELERETLAQDRGITQEAVDTVRAAVANAVPMQLEYDALRRSFLELPKVYDGEKSVRQILQEAAQAQAQAQASTSEPVVVATPEPSMPKAKTTIVFVPNRDRLGMFENPEVYEALADGFRRQNPDIQVEVRTFTGFMPDEDIARQSDVFLGKRWVPGGWPKENQYVVLVQDLGPLIDADPTFGLDDLPEVDFLLPPGYAESAVWGIPVSFDAVGIFYDKEEFQAAGVAEPGADWTWDDFRLTAAQLTSGEDESKQYGYVSRLDTLDLELFLLGRGFILPDDSPENSAQPGTMIEDQLPELKEALTWWVNLAQKDGSVAPIGSSEYILSQRRAAMWADLLGNLERRRHPVYILAKSESWHLGFAPMPRGEHAVAAVQYNIAYISTQAQDHKACWKWVRFLSEHLPPGSMTPARWSLLRSDVFKERVGAEMQAAYLQVAEFYGQGEAMIDRNALGSPFLLAFVQAIREGQSVDAALAEARRQVGQ